MSTSQPIRFCPACGSDRDEAFCPADGTATVRRMRVDVDTLNYPAGHVVVGRYRITGRLGRGGFGAVFSAVHTGTGQSVALKVLHVELGASNTLIVRRFWQEAQITAQLRHANTVRVFDVGQTEEGAFYLAMEQLHGATLADVLDDYAGRGETMPPAEVAHIGIEICKSLGEAHRAGLVHRDLKPGNVMLLDHDDGDVPVKVLDFGIAHASDSSLTGQGHTLGTPAYMSPEQCRGGGVDARSDVYSLGVLLFRCLAGQQPYNDPSPLTLMYQHLEAPVPDVRTLAARPVSDEWAAALRRAMAKDPAERFADTKEFRVALERCAHAPAAAADSPSGLTGYLPAAPAREATSKPKAKSSLRLPLLAAGVAVAAAVALAWALLAGGRQSTDTTTEPAIPAAPARAREASPAPPAAPAPTAPPAALAAPAPAAAPAATAPAPAPQAAAKKAPSDSAVARPAPRPEPSPAAERPVATKPAPAEPLRERPAEKAAEATPPKPPIVADPGDKAAEKPPTKPKVERPTALD